MTFDPDRFTERRMFAELPPPSPISAPRSTVLSPLEASPSLQNASGTSNHSPPINSGRTITRPGHKTSTKGLMANHPLGTTDSPTATNTAPAMPSQPQPGNRAPAAFIGCTQPRTPIGGRALTTKGNGIPLARAAFVGFQNQAQVAATTSAAT